VLGKLEAFGANQLTVYSNFEDEEGMKFPDAQLVLSDAEAIKAQVPSVSQVAPIDEQKMPISFNNKLTSTTVKGTTSDLLAVQNLTLATGRMFNQKQQQEQAQVTVLGAETSRKLFGDENPVGQEVLINNISFQVIGLLQSKGAYAGENLDQTAIVPLTTFANRLVGRRSISDIPISYILVTAKDKDSVRAAGFQITNILARLHGKKDVAVFANKKFQELVIQVTGVLSLLLALIAAISLLVGGIGIMNIMLVSVTERTQEIGLRKAVGATQNDILAQFLIEAIILSLSGCLLGIIFGSWGNYPLGIFHAFNSSISSICDRCGCDNIW
jgi:putative ABC transport system permease protein